MPNVVRSSVSGIRETEKESASIALTVAGLGDGWFSVSLIPETLERTILGAAAPGQRVNLEVDVLAKYVERLVSR